MKGDEGVCISPLHLSLSIRKGCSLNLSLIGSLPLEESNRFFLPPHHIGDASSFGFTVCVLLMGKSPYSHRWVLVEEPRHRKERLLQVAKEHFYGTERCLLYSMRMFRNDIESFRIAFGTIFNEGFSYHRSIYRDDLISRLVSDCIWEEQTEKRMKETQTEKRISFIAAKKQIKHSEGLILFGHNARIWDFYICESLIITVGEDCTCHVRDQHGRELNEIKEHSGREAWRCLYDYVSLLLVILGFNSTIKLHQLHISYQGLERTFVADSFSDRFEAFAISRPRSSGYGRLMDSKTVEWTELARISEEASIIGMDLYSKYSSPSHRYEVWIFGGDGKIGMTIVHIDGSGWKLEIKFTFTWPVEEDRHLISIYWCNLPEARFIFPADSEYVSCLGKRIMCLDASFDEELRLYVGRLHEEMSMLQESFEVFEVGCSKLGQRRLFFQLVEAILKLGNCRNWEIASAPHKIKEPKHRTERVFRVFKGMFQRFDAGNIQIFNLEGKVDFGWDDLIREKE